MNDIVKSIDPKKFAVSNLFKRSILLRIKSFEVRSKQAELFKQSNYMSVAALKARLKGDEITFNDMWKQSINVKNEAKSLGEVAEGFNSRAHNLEGIYYSIIEEFKE